MPQYQGGKFTMSSAASGMQAPITCQKTIVGRAALRLARLPTTPVMMITP